MKFFPDVEMPDRTERSCGLQIGTWVVIRKIANEQNGKLRILEYTPYLFED